MVFVKHNAPNNMHWLPNYFMLWNIISKPPVYKYKSWKGDDFILDGSIKERKKERKKSMGLLIFSHIMYT